jgi:GTPase SAR1 family protein
MEDHLNIIVRGCSLASGEWQPNALPVINYIKSYDKIKLKTLVEVITKEAKFSVKFDVLEDIDEFKWITRGMFQIAVNNTFLKRLEFTGVDDARCKFIADELPLNSSLRLICLYGAYGNESVNTICSVLVNSTIVGLELGNVPEEGVKTVLSLTACGSLNLVRLGFREAILSRSLYHHLFLVLKNNQSVKQLFFPESSELFTLPTEWLQECFSENNTLEDIGNVMETDMRFPIKWFAARNRICNQLQASKIQINSIPPNMEVSNIPSFLSDLMNNSKQLRAMKLVVLGDGGIGKTTLLNSMKSILDPDNYKQAAVVSTVGIECGTLYLAKGEISVWDFAGQTEFTATHSMFLTAEMAVKFVCFNLGAPVTEQTRQIAFWLDYFNSSYILPPIYPQSIPKWIIILVGVRADEQTDFFLTQNPLMVTSWQMKYPRLPISSKLFLVSSLKSPESVESLIKFVDIECGCIFDQHTVLIPSTYHQFISNLKGLAIQHPLVNLTELRNKLGVEAVQDERAFKSMLQYFHSIGKIVWLLTTGYMSGFDFSNKKQTELKYWMKLKLGACWR